MTINNSVSGAAVTTVVQAGVIAGGVHVHEAPTPVPVPVPHNLPPTTAHFAGRHGDLDRLTRLADEEQGSRVCVVDGAPGIGKTTFAVRWGSAVRDRFPDGQVYVDLRGFDPRRPPVEPDVAMRMVLDALHVPARSVPPDPDGRAAFFRSVVDDRRLLLVVDNVRDSEQVRPLLPGSPRCFTVVTARHRLDGLVLHHGARRLTLAPLTEHDAVDLLSRHLGEGRVNSERRAVGHAVAACAGHPLALSVIAARAAADPTYPLQAIVGELQDKHAALDALRLVDAIDFRAVLELSYEHLPSELAVAFRDLALHSGTGVDVRAAAAMTGDDVSGAQRTLGELVRRHLLERVGAGQHAFHSLTHVYASEKSHLHDTAGHRLTAVRSWLNHQLHAAARADRLINAHRRPIPLEPCERPELLPVLADRAEALTWFSAEYDNVQAAIATAAGANLHPYTWQLAWAMSNFAYLGARWQDWIDTHVGAVAAARRHGGRRVEVRLRQSLARAYCESGAYQRSAEEFRAALAILDEVDDPVGRANAYNGLGGVALRSGAHAEAVDVGLHALGLYSSLEDAAGTAGTYGLLGRASLALGRHEDAARYHELGRALYDESGDLYGLAHVADCLAELELSAGNPGRAEEHLREAAELHYTVGNRHYAARSCRTLRTLLLRVGRTEAQCAGLDRAIAFLHTHRAAAVAEFADMVRLPPPSPDRGTDPRH